MRQKVLLLVIAVFIAGGAFGAALNSSEIIENIINTQKNTFQFYMELENIVYNPESDVALGEKIQFNNVLIELPHQAFTQELLFIRDEFIGIKTYGSTQQLAHSYVHILDQERPPIIKNLNSYVFTEEDVLPPFVHFFSKHLVSYRQALDSYGVEYTRVRLEKTAKGIFYLLGSEDAYVKINIFNYRIEEITRQIYYNGRTYELRTEYSDWHKNQKKIPLTIRYFVDGRLFKVLKVKRIQFKKIKGFWNKMRG